MFFWPLLQGADITVHKPHPLIGCACTQQGVLLRSALLLILYAIILCHWFVTAREGNVFTGVCLSTGGRRFGFLACITGHMTGGSAQPPWMQTCPRCRPPPDIDPPWKQTPHGILRDTVNKRPVRILPECILVDLGLHMNLVWSSRTTHKDAWDTKLQRFFPTDWRTGK